MRRKSRKLRLRGFSPVSQRVGDFTTAESCAHALAPVFSDQLWGLDWGWDDNVLSKLDILMILRWLEADVYLQRRHNPYNSFAFSIRERLIAENDGSGVRFGLFAGEDVSSRDGVLKILEPFILPSTPTQQTS